MLDPIYADLDLKWSAIVVGHARFSIYYNDQLGWVKPQPLEGEFGKSGLEQGCL